MAVVDPYSPCPCGSGQKFKWCCHKVEAYAERAHRLFDSGQHAAALDAIDEGLRKEPGNAWLLTRKAIYLTRTKQAEPAKSAVRQVLGKNPGHAGAQMLMTRLVLETEGPSAGAAQLQQALTAFPPETRKDLAGLVKVVGAYLSESAEYPAALKHLRLAQSLQKGGEPDPSLTSTLRAIETNPSVSPWLKNPDALAAAPPGLAGEAKERFGQAMGWAGEGLWASAASAFETLRSDPAAAAAAAADRNLGLCRLWMADNGAAVAALRRSVARLGATPEAVDVEALCQEMDEPGPDDLVEQVQLIWPVRDRRALIAALEADPAVSGEGVGPIDPDDPNSPEADHFALLDRPLMERATPGLKAGDVPRIVGRVLVGPESAALETFDDGRLDRLSERFTAMARSGIRPAHPRTKVVTKAPRLQVALMWEWLLPAGVDAAQSSKLNQEQGVLLIREIWPNTPHPALRGRTPLQAAKAGDAETPLRAAVFQFEQSRAPWRGEIDFAQVRSMLGIGPEPAIDPETVDVATLHLARLSLVPADRLDDDRLALFYRRARQSAIPDAIQHAALALASRLEIIDRLGIETITIFTDLASDAMSSGRTEEAFAWIGKGRHAEPAAKRARSAASWDVFEVRLKTRSEPPEVWVPELAVLLDRYRDDPQATQTLMMNMIDMGLLEMAPNPDRAGEVLLDSRPLEALLAEYGPRVTTATGQLGVSAAKPEIWTPGSAGGGSGGIWTPGGGPSPPEPGGEKKLIITGR